MLCSEVCEETGVPCHIVHLSAAAALPLVRQGFLLVNRQFWAFLLANRHFMASYCQIDSSGLPIGQ
jgi:hypothetical protein